MVDPLWSGEVDYQAGSSPAVELEQTDGRVLRADVRGKVHVGFSRSLEFWGDFWGKSCSEKFLKNRRTIEL